MSYTTRAKLNARFGEDNVTKWADLDEDADAVKITATIDDRIASVTSYIDSRLRYGPYAVPFSTTPAEIEDIATSLVGSWLYDPRQTTDATNPTVDRSAQRAEAMLKDILNGSLHLDATLRITRIPGC